jgi:hypothetical protein
MRSGLVRCATRSAGPPAASSRDRLDKCPRVARPFVQNAVDEKGRRASDNSGRFTGNDVAGDTSHDLVTYAVVLEALDVEAKLFAVCTQVVVGECFLPMEEELMHLPEAVLERRRLGCAGGSYGMRMDLSQRKVAKGKANTIGKFSLDALDLMERLPRVGAFVIAVLENQRASLLAADMVNRVFDRRDDRRLVMRRHPSSSPPPLSDRCRAPARGIEGAAVS